MKEIVYLATPYTDPDPAIRESRYRDACAITAHLMRQGHVVISPIVSSHVLACDYDLPGDWQYWRETDCRLLAVSDRMIVGCLPGWEESAGVLDEISIAHDQCKRVDFLEWPVAEKLSIG